MENSQSIYYLRTLKRSLTEFRCSKRTFVLIYKNEKHLHDLLSSTWAEIDEQDQQEDKAKMKISITHIMEIVQLMDISNPITASWLIGNNLILKYNCDLNWIGNELPCMLIPKSIIGRCEN